MILFVLLLFHGLIGYAGPTTLFKPIHAVIYDALFAIEILALTACIIFHQFDAHWFGYVLVYAAIVLTWFEFFPLLNALKMHLAEGAFFFKQKKHSNKI